MSKINFNNEKLIPNNWVRAIYFAMCSKFSNSIETINEFWSMHDRILNKKYELSELYELLINSNGMIPAEYDYQVTNSLESFFISKGLDPEEFIIFASYTEKFYSFFHAKNIVYKSLKPILKTIFSIYDPRKLVLLSIPNLIKNYLPGHSCNVVPIDKHNSYIIFRYINSNIFPFNHDYHYYCKIQILNAPRMLGYKPFNSWTPVCDAREIKMCFKESVDIRILNDVLIINEIEYGKIINLKEYLSKYNLNSIEYDNLKVVEVTKDYISSFTNRIILHKGCAYSAPFYISKIGYSPIKCEHVSYIDNVINVISRITSSEKDLPDINAKTIREVHSKLILKLISKNYICEYYKQNKSETLMIKGEEGIIDFEGYCCQIMVFIINKAITSDGSELTISCKEIIEYIYPKNEYETKYNYDNCTRSFYTFLQRAINKVNLRLTNISIKTNKIGRTKYIKIIFQNCKVVLKNIKST